MKPQTHHKTETFGFGWFWLVLGFFHQFRLKICSMHNCKIAEVYKQRNTENTTQPHRNKPNCSGGVLIYRTIPPPNERNRTKTTINCNAVQPIATQCNQIKRITAPQTHHNTPSHFCGGVLFYNIIPP